MWAIYFVVNKFLVHLVRFERTTPGSEDQCSNPLSYGCSHSVLYHAVNHPAILYRDK